MKLKDFKNKILFEAIHTEERYSTISEHLKKAESIINQKHFNVGTLPHSIYVVICNRIVYLERLIKVIDDLHKQEYKPYYISRLSDYKETFQLRIKNAKKVLVKFRPYVLIDVAKWDKDRLKREIEDPEIGKFFGKWYAAPFGLS